jgi:hypothetical protein
MLILPLQSFIIPPILRQLTHAHPWTSNPSRTFPARFSSLFRAKPRKILSHAARHHSCDRHKRLRAVKYRCQEGLSRIYHIVNRHCFRCFCSSTEGKRICSAFSTFSVRKTYRLLLNLISRLCGESLGDGPTGRESFHLQSPSPDGIMQTLQQGRKKRFF